MTTCPQTTSSESARCATTGCSLSASLSAQARQELSHIARVRTFRAGETILAEAEEISFVGSVVFGVLRLQKTLHDGRQQIVGLLLPSDIFGRVFAPTSQVAVEAATDVTIRCYDRASFERLFSRFPELEHRMLVSIARELDAAHDWMTLLATLTVTERLATFLLMLRRGSSSGVRGGRASIVEVPISRRDLAAYLGTTVESISRSLQQTARSGVIRVLNSQRFEILDPGRLIALSNMDPEEFLRSSEDCVPSGRTRHDRSRST